MLGWKNVKSNEKWVRPPKTSHLLRYNAKASSFDETLEGFTITTHYSSSISALSR